MTIPEAPYVFPFGQPVLPYRRSDRSPRRVFVLGAYPSALHVRWEPPSDFKPVQAVAVDNEPAPSWDGKDEVDRIGKWKKQVDFREEWGVVGPVGDRNGGFGRSVLAHVLDPLNIDLNHVWFTDCLDTYHSSPLLTRRIEDTYNKALDTLKLPATHLPPHPDESRIVKEAQLDRLRDELATAHSTIIVTLGNAALRVVRALSSDPEGKPQVLELNQAKYGQPFSITIEPIGAVSLLPLAHPATPAPYKVQHQHWIRETAEHVSRTLNAR